MFLKLKGSRSLFPVANPTRIALTVAGALLLVPISWRIFTLTQPAVPIPFVLPLLLGLPPSLAVGFPSVIFCLWCQPFFRGGLVPAHRTMVAFVLVALLSTVVFGLGWHDGFKYQEASFTIRAAIISFGGAALVLLMLALSRRTSSFPLQFATNFVLFAWVFTYALPYLGELS